MKSKTAQILLLGAASVATFTALAHLSCIILGPQCYKSQLAPDFIVESAIQGTWLAPIGAILISLIFFICAAYAISKAGFIRKLPLLDIGIYTIAIVCIIRGLLTFQLKLRYPELVGLNDLIIGGVWFVTGLMFWFGGKWKSTDDIKQSA